MTSDVLNRLLVEALTRHGDDVPPAARRANLLPNLIILFLI